MNRYLITILALLFSFRIFGQLLPQSEQYILNPLTINPAFAGCHDALSVTFSYRNQWVGFEGAPKSQILSIHAPLNSDRIGLGLLIEKNSIGIYNETHFMSNYAYRVEIQNGKLALGLGFGFVIYNIAWNDLKANDIGDDQLSNNSNSAVLPNFSLGAYYYTKKYFIGASVPRFLSHELDHNTGKYRIKNDFSEYNYLFSGGYNISINRYFTFLPSLLIKYHPNNAVQIDYNAQINYNERVWIGMGYRNKDILIGMIQCQLNYQIKMAYSYNYDIGTLGKYLNGSHEILLNYIFRYARKVKGPRNY
jgi:type IX secretion system PorP/SprF family membrane protein